MKTLRPFFVGLCMTGAFLSTGCQPAAEPQAPVALSWSQGSERTASGFTNHFTLKNVSDQPLKAGNWSIYYTQLPNNFKQADDSPIKMEDVNGNFFRIYPTEHFTELAPGDSLTVSFYGRSIDRNSQAPEAPYWVGEDGKPLPMTYHAARLEDKSVADYPDAAKLYANNAQIPAAPALKQTDIIPSVKQAVPQEGSVVLDGTVALKFPEEFAGEAQLLKEKLADIYGIQVADEAAATITLESAPCNGNPEAYTLSINKEGVKIAAATAHGAFNGTQTLLAMLKGKQAPYELQGVMIADQPDMFYRGFMLDVARNFTTPENVKHLIDILASYKMNMLHFHFNDDEAWRLEIPGLEELTAVAAHRGHTTDESECLYPGYSGGYDYTTDNLSNGYFTRDQFIDLLRYAAARHISVLPELETPGHARAAIVAMKARYNKYAATDMAKATEYMLHEPADTSVYKSVQAYKDNVINVALPSTYNFLRKVVRELKAMYAEAGVTLPAIHLGGDEVANGAWTGSPACQALMKEKGMTKKHDLAEYYITEIAKVMKEEGVKISGWQEVALGHTEEAHKQLREQMYSINCWTAVPDWGTDKVVYEIANNGYPVVLSNVCNFYMDLAYSHHPDERGLDWGGVVDEARSFSTLPFRNYRSCRTTLKGAPMDMSKAEKGKPALTTEGQQNMIGVSAQFFAETLRGYDWLQYYLFPKYMGLVERGWNAHPAWESLEGAQEENTYLQALALYERVIAEKEMSDWAKRGINFRVAHPGLKVEDGMLYTNSVVPGAEIRYTIDGSEPTAESALWTAPVACDAKTIKAKTFYKGKESVTMTLWTE